MTRRRRPSLCRLPAWRMSSPRGRRRVAAIAAELKRERGFDGTVESTVPIGAGLSSSGALGVALALALGASEGHSRLDIALLCQRAQQAATGVPAGVLDEMASLHGLAGHAILLDCHDLTVEPVALPEDAQVVVKYISRSHRRREPLFGPGGCLPRRRAGDGPPTSRSDPDLSPLTDPVLLHGPATWSTENERVRQCVEALKSEDLVHRRPTHDCERHLQPS